MENIVQTIVLLTVLSIYFGCIAIQEKKWLKIILSACLLVNAILIITYFVVDGFTANGIDRSFLYHVNTGFDGAGFGQYYSVVALCALWLFITIITLIAAIRINFHLKWKSVRFFGAVVCLASISFNPAVIDLYNIRKSEYGGVTKPLHFKEYFDNVKIEKKRNIVYVYLESLERTYFDESVFPNLVPNLKLLEKKSLTFRGVNTVEGGGWTIGGIVSSACGIPLLNKAVGNSLDNSDSFLKSYKCLGDILKENGYHNVFIGGADKKFGGKSAFYESHSFDKVIGKQEFLKIKPAMKLNSWGAYDADVYSMVFDEMKKQKKPYMIQMLTVETHHPAGIQSDVCSNYKYMDGNDPMLNAVHCADAQLGQFVEKLLSENPDVLIVIQSDHMAMKNSLYSKLMKMKRENLFMIVNSGEGEREIWRNASTLDVLPTVLATLGVKLDKYGYGVNLLDNRRTLPEILEGNVNAYLTKHIPFYSKYWNKKIIKDNVDVVKAGDKIKIDDIGYNLPVMFEFDNSELAERLYEKDDSLQMVKQVSEVNYGNNVLIVDLCSRIYSLNNRYSESSDACYAIGALGSKSLKIGRLNKKINIPSINPKEDSNEQNRLRRLTYLRDFFDFGTSNTIDFSGKLGIKSGKKLFFRGSSNGVSSSVAYSDVSKIKDTPLRGLTIYGVKKDGTFDKVEYMDTCDPLNPVAAGEIPPIHQIVSNNNSKYIYYVLLSTDSAICVPGVLERVLSVSSLNRWRDLKPRQTYIVVFDAQGNHWEYVGYKNEPIAVKFN